MYTCTITLVLTFICFPAQSLPGIPAARVRHPGTGAGPMRQSPMRRQPGNEVRQCLGHILLRGLHRDSLQIYPGSEECISYE